MPSPRYTILIANRKTGAVRRLTLVRRTALGLAGVALVLPFLIGLGASNPDPIELESLRQANQNLRQENESYLAATGQLTDQISSLQSALTDLDTKAQLDPVTRQALDRLPAVIRSRAAGGAPSAATAVTAPPVTASVDTTFGVLKNLLSVLETRLASVKSSVESQQALARATPSIWPIVGWLSSGFGKRADPFDGSEEEFHTGLDIAADKGTPVKATADGTVSDVGYNGSYGNTVLVDNGYGISTRFGHLSRFNVSQGQTLHRGDIIGYVGATGRATSPHLHYEILVNGQPINPLRLLAR